jgi:hypothetical protein
MQAPSQEIIEKAIFKNYIEYQHLFVEFQSKFLSDLYFRHKSIENGNVVLYFASQTHQEILRKKDYDFNFDISLEKFWDNHREIIPKQKSIIKVAEDIHLPKETARRKILQLTKQKVLNKKNKNIGWLPDEQYKQIYDLNISSEIEGISRLIRYVCEKINISISNETVVKELKDKFSFYWLHHLNVQLKYLKTWSKQFGDLEILLVALQLASLFARKTKEKNLSYKDIYENSSLIKEFMSASISATSIADVTGIPRATCVRKLDTLVRLKIVLQDKISKRYYLLPDVTTKNLIPKESTKRVVKFFSEFYFICIRALVFKNLS